MGKCCRCHCCPYWPCCLALWIIFIIEIILIGYLIGDCHLMFGYIESRAMFIWHLLALIYMSFVALSTFTMIFFLKSVCFMFCCEVCRVIWLWVHLLFGVIVISILLCFGSPINPNRFNKSDLPYWIVKMVESYKCDLIQGVDLNKTNPPYIISEHEEPFDPDYCLNPIERCFAKVIPFLLISLLLGVASYSALVVVKGLFIAYNKAKGQIERICPEDKIKRKKKKRKKKKKKGCCVNCCTCCKKSENKTKSNSKSAAKKKKKNKSKNKMPIKNSAEEEELDHKSNNSNGMINPVLKENNGNETNEQDSETDDESQKKDEDKENSSKMSSKNSRDALLNNDERKTKIKSK